MEADNPIADAASPLAEPKTVGDPEWMQQPQDRRSWTIAIFAGVIVLVLVAFLCVAGGAAGFLALRSSSGEAAAPTPETVAAPSVSPSASPSPSPSPPSPAACLVGDWVMKTSTNNTQLFGVNVQLTGSGWTSRYSATEIVVNLNNVVMSGQANGDSYEVIHNGTITLNYQATENTIYYSNPRVVGSTTWKVNGRTRDSEPLRASLKSETYMCAGDQLRVYTDVGAAELTRVATS
jgi:hypothetical protein